MAFLKIVNEDMENVKKNGRLEKIGKACNNVHIIE
jgi:hypothetical protein